MAYGKTLVDEIQSSTTGVAPVFRDGNGNQIGTMCRAWVSFNGVGGVSIRASFNVSSITRVSGGLYLVTFTNAMIDGSYSCVANAQPNGYSGAFAGTGSTAAGNQTSTQASIEVRQYNNYNTDSDYIQCAVFR